METIKSNTDLQQSKKLAEFLPLESADNYYSWHDERYYVVNKDCLYPYSLKEKIPCWGLVALLKYLSEIKPQVYTPILFPSESKWILQFVEYGHGNVCEVSYDNPIDACCGMILKLHELNKKK